MQLNNSFIDYYEVLQVSPNAHADTIDRVFRLLAQRYHPDNQQTGDVDHFRQVVEAHEVLRDPESRARYDLRYKQANENRWKLTLEVINAEGYDNDKVIQDRLLSLFYVKRKTSLDNPGLGTRDLEHILGYPREKLEFHLWYLREKGWIRRLEDGLLAITADGVDKATNGGKGPAPDHMLTNQHAPEAQTRFG